MRKAVVSPFYEALNTKLEEENAVTNLMEQIVHNMDYVSPMRF
ncbi:MAG: hypothetical protein ACLTXT_02455 [Ruminococcus callidus]